MTDPLRMSFDVACPADHAFSVWTSDIGTWWPDDHTVTGRGDVAVVLECRVGGRIFERTPEGDEHDWGEVTVLDLDARGTRGAAWRERNQAGWASLLPHLKGAM